MEEMIASVRMVLCRGISSWRTETKAFFELEQATMHRWIIHF